MSLQEVHTASKTIRVLRGENPYTPVDALIELNKIFKEYNVPYTLVGGIAAGIHGVGKSTVDVDVVIHVTGHEGDLIRLLTHHGYKLRFSPTTSSEMPGVKFMQFKDPHDTDVDIIYGDTPFLANLVKYAGVSRQIGIRVASPESLAALKYMASLSPTRNELKRDGDRLAYRLIMEESNVNHELVDQLIQLARRG